MAGSTRTYKSEFVALVVCPRVFHCCQGKQCCAASWKRSYLTIDPYDQHVMNIYLLIHHKWFITVDPYEYLRLTCYEGYLSWVCQRVWQRIDLLSNPPLRFTDTVIVLSTSCSTTNHYSSLFMTIDPY